MRRLFVLTLLLAAACTPASPTAVATLVYTGLGLERLDAARVTFEVRFEGTYAWIYRLETRVDGSVVAYDLHLEGVEAAQNPGDVRVVIEGEVARMRGPGTGDVCVQFPTDLEMAPAFLTPDDLIPPGTFEEPLEAAGSETVAGVAVTHYASGRLDTGTWRDLEVDLWRDEASGAVLRYELQGAGLDPLFDAGEGTLSGQFLVEEIGPQEIEPVPGCESDLPLPPDAARLVRLPGLIAFESGAPPDETAAFYRAALPAVGWGLSEEIQAGGVILQSYARGEEMLNVSIEASGEGSHVELLEE